jgi:hypothetical protein
MNPRSFNPKISLNLLFNLQNVRPLLGNGEKRVKIVRVVLRNWKMKKMPRRENYLSLSLEKMNLISQYKGKRVVVEVVVWEMLFDVLDVYFPFLRC